jgi:mannosyltransferase
MTLPGHRTVLTRPRPVPAPRAPQPPPRSAQPATGALWMRLLPAAVMLGLTLWGITGASYWRDESATLEAVHRPLNGLLRLLGHVDAVHGAYYLIMWPLVRLLGPGELVTRLPSALAMTAAAALVTAIGRRLVSPAAGLAAGLLFAAIPAVSFYGQDARSYALVTALATAASYLLVRVLTTAGPRRGWLAGYAACMAAAGILNIFGLLLLAAHAITVALACARRSPGRSRRLALGWLAAAAAAAAAVSPVVALAYGERGQLAWLVKPGLTAVTTMRQLIGAGQMPLALGAALGAGLLLSALGGRTALRVSWPPALPALAVPWLVLPPGLLLAASQVTPLYTLRYVMLSAPAGALLGGTAIAAIGRSVRTGCGWTTGTGAGRRARALAARVRQGLATGPRARTRRAFAVAGWAAGAGALVTVALLGAPAQVHDRTPAGHGDNIRAADQIIAARLRPGDVAIYDTPANENLAAAYPYGMSQLPSIALQRSPEATGTLAGVTLPPAVVRPRIQGAPRVWVTEIHHDRRLPVLQGLGLRLAGRWHVADLWVLLYVQPRG